ncbi:PREDICTED: uncharacterized protein LOC109213996 [Nicotiana attenuata]|uniref:uncharacterized protein LOC109213996 n=1 Tax=Nicotiana attenuata TaxID=49451 RepID=UPI0009047A7B|nr:PREDICTED: uncharacterized protein LOC109213996 [Nicotiana attenuata]
MESAFPPREMQDAPNTEFLDVGTSVGDKNMLEKPSSAPEEKPDTNISLIFNEIDRLCEQAKVLYNQTFANFETELTRHEDEHKKLTSEADELRALSTKREEELRSLRDFLEAASREKDRLAEQEKDVLMGKELRARDSKILELKRHLSEVISERDALRGEVVLIGHCLEDAMAESSKYKDLHTELATTLSEVRAEVEALVTSHKEDAATANAQAPKVFKEAELRLTGAVEHAQLKSRRQTLEDIYAGGIDLIIERVKTLEEEAAALLPSEDESSSDSVGDEDGGGVCEGEEAVGNPEVMVKAVESVHSEGAVSPQSLRGKYTRLFLFDSLYRAFRERLPM